MRNRILYALEQTMRFLLGGSWTELLPSKIEGWAAEVHYGIINLLRRRRLNVPTTDCEGCGYAFPRDDLSQFRLSDGKLYPHCRECVEFRVFIRTIFSKRTEVA